MTRVFLAAGVAALAIAAPAGAGPHGGGNPHNDQPNQQAQRQTFAAQRQQMAPQREQRQQMRAERQQMRPMRIEQAQNRAVERQQMRMERQQMRPVQMQQAQHRAAERQQIRDNRMQRAQQRVAQHQQIRDNRMQQVQNRVADRQQIRGNRTQQVQNRMADRQQIRDNRLQQVQNRMADRQQMRIDRMNNRQAGQMANNGRGYGVGGCPPGLQDKGCMPPGLARNNQLQALRSADARVFNNSRIQLLTPRTRILAPTQVVQYVGQPVSTVGNYVQLAELPQSVSYLYPSTPDYYYRYGDGYLYQVDRGSNLIQALLPLLAGGYMPGSYLPSSYMSSYVPDYYGLNSFYPASYGSGYGYGYDNLCNRYAYGNIYQVDCATGMVENVIPMYAGGYGVGQMIPSAYSTYNVPMQYRSMYYPTNDASYWYAPGAIYQYDPSSSLITSVAALLSPGFSVGQPLPAGYDMYNVPMAYRSTYYDTPDAWYRYNNGYIYRVDPTTQLVSAVVASLLT